MLLSFRTFSHRWVQITVRWLSPDRLKLYPPHIPVLFLLAWGVSLYLGPGLLDWGKTIVGADFIAFYNGGRFFLEDRMAELYSFHAQEEFQAHVTDPIRYTNVHVFINPPFTVLFFSAFALGDYLTGLFLWWLLSLFLLWAVAYLLHRHLDGLKKYSVLQLMGYAFCFYPLILCIIFGQNTFITLFLYTLFYIFLTKNRDFSAGVALGFLLYKPQLGLALGLIVLLQRRWRAVAGAALSVLFCLVAGFKISTKAMMDFFHLLPSLTSLIRHYKVPCPYLNEPSASIPPELVNDHYIYHLTYPSDGIQSFFGFASILLDRWSPLLANGLFILLTLGFGFVFLYTIVRMEWNPKSRRWHATMAGLISLGLLLSPHLFDYDLMLLLLPLAILLHAYPQGTNNRPLDGGPLLAWTAVLYGITIVGRSLTLQQIKLAQAMGLPEMGVQLLVLVLALWSLLILRKARNFTEK